MQPYRAAFSPCFSRGLNHNTQLAKLHRTARRGTGKAKRTLPSLCARPLPSLNFYWTTPSCRRSARPHRRFRRSFRWPEAAAQNCQAPSSGRSADRKSLYFFQPDDVVVTGTCVITVLLSGPLGFRSAGGERRVWLLRSAGNNQTGRQEAFAARHQQWGPIQFACLVQALCIGRVGTTERS